MTAPEHRETQRRITLTLSWIGVLARIHSLPTSEGMARDVHLSAAFIVLLLVCFDLLPRCRSPYWLRLVVVGRVLL